MVSPLARYSYLMPSHMIFRVFAAFISEGSTHGRVCLSGLPLSFPHPSPWSLKDSPHSPAVLWGRLCLHSWIDVNNTWISWIQWSTLRTCDLKFSVVWSASSNFIIDHQDKSMMFIECFFISILCPWLCSPCAPRHCWCPSACDWSVHRVPLSACPDIFVMLVESWCVLLVLLHLFLHFLVLLNWQWCNSCSRLCLDAWRASSFLAQVLYCSDLCECVSISVCLSLPWLLSSSPWPMRRRRLFLLCREHPYPHSMPHVL